MLQELQTAATDRRQEIGLAAAYLNRMYRALSSQQKQHGDSDDGVDQWIQLAANEMDPEAARLLNRLNRRSRLAESGLRDLDTQVDAMLAETAQTPPGQAKARCVFHAIWARQKDVYYSVGEM